MRLSQNQAEKMLGMSQTDCPECKSGENVFACFSNYAKLSEETYSDEGLMCERMQTMQKSLRNMNEWDAIRKTMICTLH